MVLVFSIILFEACRFVYLPVWSRVCSAFCGMLQLSFSFGIFGFVCVILPPILVEVLASHFAVTIWLSFGF